MDGPACSVAYCPLCGRDLRDPRGFVQEYWTGREVNFLAWCPQCRNQSTITVSDRVIISEPEH